MAKSSAKRRAPRHYSVEQLMMMAIEEGRRSIPEHQDKADPLVGAIIATADGQVLAKAHRGELRIGEHCEFTLIERKLRDQNLRGCVLYVTLEPCTDDSRNPPKRGCSTHVVKARFSTVYVGIEDPNPKIATKGIRFMESHGIQVHLFPDHLGKIIRTENATFIREKEKEALLAGHPAIEKPRGMLEAPLLGKSLESLSAAAIDVFLRKSESPLHYPSEEFNQWMLDLGFAERIDNGSLSPTGIGLLLFGTHPQSTFPQAVFRAEINYGSGETEIKDFGEPLVQQLPAILSYVREKALRLTIDRSSGIRKEQTDFPFEVLREAIANAVIHRDYSIEGSTNYFYIDAETIIVRSPGEPQKPATLQEMLRFDVGSSTRNPKIMYIFAQMKLAEQRGIGLRNMHRLPEQGYSLPVFTMLGDQLEVKFDRIKGVTRTTTELSRSLSSAEQAGLIYLQRQGEATAVEYAKFMKINPKAAQRQLKRLVEDGLVETVGSRRWTKYRRRTP